MFDGILNTIIQLTICMPRRSTMLLLELQGLRYYSLHKKAVEIGLTHLNTIMEVIVDWRLTCNNSQTVYQSKFQTVAQVCWKHRH
jgi:hypothetical protein